MIRTLHEGLLADHCPAGDLHSKSAERGLAVPLTKLCAWFGVPRRSVYYKPVKSPPKIDPAFEAPIKEIPFAHVHMCCPLPDRAL